MLDFSWEVKTSVKFDSFFFSYSSLCIDFLLFTTKKKVVFNVHYVPIGTRSFWGRNGKINGALEGYAEFGLGMD